MSGMREPSAEEWAAAQAAVGDLHEASGSDEAHNKTERELAQVFRWSAAFAVLVLAFIAAGMWLVSRMPGCAA